MIVLKDILLPVHFKALNSIIIVSLEGGVRSI